MSAETDPIATHRPRLFGLAYRMLGSVSLAEDMVQEAYVRWYSQPRDEVASEGAFLTTIVTNLCLDHLKSARNQREIYPGEWLPEPVALQSEAANQNMPVTEISGPIEDDLERLQSISMAFLLLLDSLTPLERAAYLLHEVFDYSHKEVARILGREEAACRQVYRRARSSLEKRRKVTGSPERHAELLHGFLCACEQGDVDSLSNLLAKDVVYRADGGGKVKVASRQVTGSRAVARLYAGLWKQGGSLVEVAIHNINGWPAIIVSTGNILRAVVQIHTDGEQIDEIDAVLNPEKLRNVARTLEMEVGA